MGFSVVAVSRGYSLVAVQGLLIAVASLIADRVQALGHSSFIVVAHGLSSCGSRAL